MANHTTQFQAWWEYTSSQRPSCNITGADFPIPLQTPPSPAPITQQGLTHQANGVSFTMLIPAPPSTLAEHVEEATPSPEQTPAVTDEAPTFTNLDRPVSQPYGSYGAGFVINPSTGETRLRARAEIFGDAPSSGHSSGTPESQHTRHWSTDMAALQSRTERLQERVKRGLKSMHDSVGRKMRQVRIAEQITFQRMGSVRRRGVNRTKPITNLLRDTARATMTHAAVLTGRVTKADVPRRQLSVRSLGGASRLSRPQSTQVDPGIGVDFIEREGGNRIPAGSSPVGKSETVVWQPLTPSRSSSNEGTSEPATDILQNRLDEHERAQMMHRLNRGSSIRAHMAAFSFNTLVPMDIIPRFEPAQRTATMANNLIVATRDMMKLSQIWSRLFSPTPALQCLISANPLLILSDDDAEKLCQLMEHGLHCWAYWSLATELSVNEEEAMDDEWLSDLGAKLDDMGRPDTEAIFHQIASFGADYVDAPHLESVMRKTKCLDVGMSIRRRSTRRVPSTFLNDEVFELDAVETEIKRASPTDKAPVSSGPNRESRPMIPTEEGSQHQPTHEQTTHQEELIFETRRESVSADEESNLEELVPSSPGILEELNAALDEALDENTNGFPEPVEDESPWEVLPCTTKTSQPAQTRCNGTWPRHSQHRKGQVQHEPASFRLTHENGWISAEVLANSSPEDFDLGSLLPKDNELPGPPHLSERAKGKLPMARSESARLFPGHIVVPPYRGPATSRTLPRGMTFGESAPNPQAPPAKFNHRQRIPQPHVQTQAVPRAGSTDQTVARSPFVAATMRSLSTATRAKPTPKTSQTLPRSFTMRTNSHLKPPSPAHTSKPNRLETARRLLNASANPARSSGAARISLSGTTSSGVTSRASRVPLGPIGRSVVVDDSSVRFSRPITGAEEVKAEAPRNSPRPTMATNITSTSGERRSRLPVSRTTAIMPGTYPASDAETEY